jgi:hypothetical protein
MAPDELARLRAKAGYRLGIEIKPGMPMGVLAEALVVHTNHPDRPTIDISIAGIVTGPVTAAPTRLSIPAGGAPDGVLRHVMLMVHDGRETRFDVLHKPGAIGVSTTPVDAPPGKRRYRLTVTAPAGGASDRRADFITVKTDHPKVGLVRIPVSFTGAATDSITATLAQLTISVGHARGGDSRDVMLLVHDGRETRFDILDKPGGVGASIAPVDAPPGKRRYRLTVTPTAGGGVAREREFLIVKTDHPKARLVTIPIDFATRRADDSTAEGNLQATRETRGETGRTRH